MGTLKIKVRYLTDMPHLQYIGDKSDWIDLRAAEDVDLSAGDHKLIPLGVAMKLPDGYEAHLVPRSSSFKNWGVLQTNGIGIIDNSYCGDNDQWMWSVFATRDAHIPAGSRVCQFRLVKKMAEESDIRFEATDHLSDKDRGGFGSTGSV